MNVLRLAPVTLLLLALGCGGDAPSAAPPGQPNGQPPAPGGGAGNEAPTGDVVELHLQGNDMMQFDVKSFEVQAGQRVRVTIKNVGTMPKVAMGHNVVVLKKGVKAADFGIRVATSGKGTLDNDHLPEDFRKETLAHTKLVGPGESASTEFTAPALPGELEYVCTFPGHFATMNGKIVVK